MSKKRNTPRGKVEHYNTPHPPFDTLLGEPEIHLASWSPDPDGEAPPEQIHLIFIIPHLEAFPLICRFKSPDTLGFIIEKLTDLRRLVWPDCDPIAGEEADNG